MGYLRTFVWQMGIIGFLGILSGCGYALQTSKNPLLEKEGIKRIYVEPFLNHSFKAGVDQVVHNVLVKTLSSHRRVALVEHPEDADALLKGVVTSADYLPAELKGVPVTGVNVASDYSATLNCSFTLWRRRPVKGKRDVIWAATYVRGPKRFPGANQLDVLGTTSSLINETEFERVLGDLATSMMEDLHESMLAMF